MMHGPDNEEPGFGHDLDERFHEEDKGSQYTLEDNPQVQDDEANEMEKTQKDAAEERKEGGYQ